MPVKKPAIVRATSKHRFAYTIELYLGLRGPNNIMFETEKKKRGFPLPAVGRRVPVWIIVLLVVLLSCGCCGLFGLMSGYGFINSIRSEAVAKETGLTAGYGQLQNKLDARVTDVVEQFNLTSAASDQVTEFMSQVIAGQVGTEGLSTDNLLVLAIDQAYPELSAVEQTAMYRDVLASLQDNQTAYRAEQDAFLDQVRNYENWWQGDLLRKFVIDTFLHLPTDNLRVTVGTQVYTGEEALTYMRRVITSTAVQDAVETGTYEGTQFGDQGNQGEQ